MQFVKSKIHATAIVGSLAVVALITTLSAAQVQSTITCQSGDWDTLSIMMLDPGLASGYHMEGEGPNGPTAYNYTTWNQSQTKLWMVKNKQGYPWDIDLYDQQYVYQWVTELNWSTDSECKKFNNGSQQSNADYSFRWVPRCAKPGSSSMWNPPPPAQPNNSNYYTISSGQIINTQNLGYALLELKPTTTITLYDTRSTPTTQFTATDMPIQYTYSCYLQNNVDSCASREVFDYAVDTTVNPVDSKKHAYGWVQWRLYNNTAYVNGKNPPNPANWVESTNPPPSLQDHLVAGYVSPQFACF